LNRSRNVALNPTNAQVADFSSSGILATFGFTKRNVRLPFRVNGAIRRLKNDLTFNMAVNVQDSRDMQRKLDGTQQILGRSLVNVQIDPQLSYMVNKRLNVNVFFRRFFNNPFQSQNIPQSETSGGIRVRFNLAE
jgi:cell surface protein SprA